MKKSHLEICQDRLLVVYDLIDRNGIESISEFDRGLLVVVHFNGMIGNGGLYDFIFTGLAEDQEYCHLIEAYERLGLCRMSEEIASLSSRIPSLRKKFDADGIVTDEETSELDLALGRLVDSSADLAYERLASIIIGEDLFN